MSTNPVSPGVNHSQQAKTESQGTSQQSLYIVGGVAALLAVLAYVLDIVVSLGGSDTAPGALNAVEWFVAMQDNPLLALRTLGLLNIISVTLGIPIYCALYAAHHQVNRNYTTLAVIIFAVGAAIYMANNAAAPIYMLSGKYVIAPAGEQQALIAAGEAILARGEDFTPGSFIGFFFTEIAGLVVSFVMLYGKIFSKAAAYSGILGFSLLSVFTVWATFIPVLYGVAMLLAMVGGLASLAWYVLMARQLFWLGSRAQIGKS